MIELAVLITPLLGGLDLFQKKEQHAEAEAHLAEAKRQEALQTMLTALIATRRYTEAQPDGVDRDKQFELSKLWGNVAIKCREYLQEEVPWSMEKARYWLDNIEWPEERVQAAGIDLVTVENRIAELMRQ